MVSSVVPTGLRKKMAALNHHKPEAFFYLFIPVFLIIQVFLHSLQRKKDTDRETGRFI